MVNMLDGKKIAQDIKEQIKQKIIDLQSNSRPGLAVIIVGKDPASLTYVKAKGKACAEVGIYSEKHSLTKETSQEQLVKLIAQLNNDPKIDGILVQLPLPDHIDEQAVIEKISVEKDVDGFHVINAGKLLNGQKCILPCTPAGCMELIDRTGISLEGKNVVIVGRSNIVGKPVALLALQRNATVTICHSRTANLESILVKADVIIAAVGRPLMITSDMVKRGAIVIDVGINRVQDKLVGDVDYDTVSLKAAWITPVPGGVGPMTIAMLLKNTFEAWERKL